MSHDNVQKDFFIDQEPDGGSSKKFFKEKPIKKNQFTITFSYEIISMGIIGIVIFLAFFFYLGTLVKISNDSRNVAKGAIETQSEQKLPDLEVSPNREALRPLVEETALGKDKEKPDVTEEEPAYEPVAKDKPTSGYALQVATFKSDVRAKKEMSYIRSLNYKAFNIPSGEYYQICIGPFVEKEEVLKIKEKLKDRYKDSFLRKLKGN